MSQRTPDCTLEVPTALAVQMDVLWTEYLWVPNIYTKI